MKHFKFITVICIAICITLSAVTLYGVNADPIQQTDEIVFAMCRPQKSQIRNIKTLLEKKILPLTNIKLIGVYHQDELTDYSPAIEYVAEEKLSWVTFQTVKGSVKPGDLFKKNQWTETFRELFNKTSGIIFTGGEDIPPALYGEDQLLLTDALTPMRSYYELSFLFHLIGSSRNPGFTPFLDSRPDYTILGICLGAQSMNVAAGGTMYQDIPSQVYKLKTVQQVLAMGEDRIHSSRYIRALHPQEDDHLPPAFHRIKLKKKDFFITRLQMKPDDLPYVLSSHHQGLRKIGKNLTVIATSMDGILPEAIHHQKYPNVLGVQFHPEYYLLFKEENLFIKKPGDKEYFNLPDFLKSRPPSTEFHKAIWKWFAESMKKEK